MTFDLAQNRPRREVQALKLAVSCKNRQCCVRPAGVFSFFPPFLKALNVLLLKSFPEIFQGSF